MITMDVSCAICPADRLSTVSEYYFSRKLKEVAEMNRQGLPVINLGVGSPDLPPSDDAIRVLCASAGEAGSHGYQSYTGILELRNAFSAWYGNHYRVALDPASEILPLIGSKEGILHISLAFLNPGDKVLVPNPGYPTYRSVSRMVGADILEYDLLEEQGWFPDLDALERLDLSRVRLMWVNYPHMPTGTPATKELFEKLVRFGKRHGIVICNDNPYSFILNDNPLSILEIPGAKEVCIEMNSLSKSHNMPGWRVGMVASNSRFIGWILKVKSNIDSGQFKPVMLAAAQALQMPSSWYREMNRVYAGRRRSAESILKLLSCTFDPQQTGLFLWGKIPPSCRNSEELADEVLYNSRVFVTPGSIFGSNGERFIRLSLCCPEEKLAEAGERIGRIRN